MLVNWVQNQTGAKIHEAIKTWEISQLPIATKMHMGHDVFLQLELITVRSTLKNADLVEVVKSLCFRLTVTNP